MRKFLAIVGLLAAAALTLLPRPGAADDITEVRVVLPHDYLPLSGSSVTGEPGGMLPDIWRLWSRKTGVPVTLTLRKFSDTLSDIRHNRADVHGSLFRNEARESWLEFSRPLHEVSTSIYYLRDRENVESMASFRGARAGVIKATHQENALLNSSFGLKVVPFHEPADMLAALARGDIDLLVHEDLAMTALLDRTGIRGNIVKLPGEVMRNTISAAWISKRADLRKLVDWGFSLISRDELAEIERRWITSPDVQFFKPIGTSLPFTTAEKDWLERNKVIRVGVQTNWPPMSSVENGGNAPEGMSIELLKLMNERLGGAMTFVPDTWPNLLEAVEEKRLDAVIDINPTRSRMGRFSFTEPYLVIPHVIMARDGNIGAIASLSGKTLAIEKGYSTVEFIRQNYPDIRILELPDTVEALTAVATGDADAWIGNRSVATYLADIHGGDLRNLHFAGNVDGRSSTLAIGVREDWGIFRNILNKAIIGITPAQRAFITDPWLAEKYTGQIDLSAAEQRWLSRYRNEEIRVLLEEWPPFSHEVNGRPSGMAVDYLKQAFNTLGLEATFVKYSWTEALQGITDLEKVDVVPALAPSPERAEVVALTRPYLRFPIVIFTRDDGEILTGLDDLGGKDVAVEQDFIMEARLSMDYPEIRLVRFDTTLKAIEAVSLGQADAYVGNLAAGSFYIQNDGFSNLKVAAPTSYTDGEQAMGVRRDWPELASMLDKALAQMTDEQHTRIRSSALAVRYETGIDMRKILTYALPAVGVIAIIILVIVFANRKLHYEVRERRRVQEELAERESWFKSLLESAPDATVIVNPEGSIVQVNRQAEILFGVNRHQLIGEKIERLVPERIRPKHVGYRHGFVTASAPREMGANMKLTAQRWDGSEFPVEISLSPIETKNGTLIAASVRDVTERRAAERVLHEKDLQLTAALENMSGGILMIDRDQHVRVFNKKFVEMYALPDVTPGMPLRELVELRATRGEYGPGDRDKLVEERLAGYRDGSIAKIEDHTIHGTVIEGFRQPTSDGGMVCIFNDISIRKKAEESLATQTRKLQELSTKLSRYLSPQIYEAIFAGASDAVVRTERKKLTVFFSDIKSFTATTEEMEPEDMTFLLNDYLTKMTEIALEYGGTIDKYIGDAIMVFFGDPETEGVKKDALKAVRMAVAMQRRMVDLRAKWADMGYRHPFHIRCGINTGYCNVGNFGSDQRIDYTIIGGQVNLAARLESICEPDGITIAHETYSHVRDEFDAEPMEPIQVKGIRDPVEPYSISGIFEDWDETERYIRRDDIRGLRIWVDLMRMTEEQRLASLSELEEVMDILKLRKADKADFPD
jgi:PAS domain S-box-containing protein